MTKTKKEMFVAIREVVADNAEMTAFIDHELELLAKRSTSERKPTKVQIENDGFKADILAHLATADAPMTIKEIQAAVESVSGLTNQRITRLLTDLVNAESLVKTYIKKTPYYAVA